MGLNLIHAAWLTSAMVLSPQVMTEPEQAIPPKDYLHQDLQHHACSNEYIIFGDTDHTDISIMGFVAEPATLQTLLDCSISKLFVEIIPEYQSEIDSLMDGSLSYEDFIATTTMQLQTGLEAFAGMTIAAGRAGMTVIASDVQNDLEHYRRIEQLNYLILNEYFELAYSMGDEELARAIFTHILFHVPLADEYGSRMEVMIAEHQDNIHYEAAQEYLTELEALKALNIIRTDDALLVDFIKANKGEGERVAILIGNGHPANRDVGIDIRLGAENTHWIALQSTNPKYGNAANAALPDRIYDLPSRKVIIHGPVAQIP